MGTTGLYLFGAAAGGEERDSDGFLAQVTYKLGATKLGLNYGESNLDLASGEASSDLVESNKKYTVGAYHSLTEALTLDRKSVVWGTSVSVSVERSGRRIIKKKK